MKLSSYDPINSLRNFRRLYEQMYGDDGGFKGEAGDPGLIGPGMAWRILAENCILVGGIMSLFLQMLDPPTVKGVVEKSDYKEKALERLLVTGDFVRITAFGPTALAQQWIEIVQRVHEAVRGTMPDGSEYYANDPEQLRWVHVCETYGFARAYQRYGLRSVSRKLVDQYYSEHAIVAESLGAAPVPRSCDEVNAYFERKRPELARTDDSDDVLRFVLRPKADDAALELFFRVIGLGAVGLLPDWARRLHGLRRSPVEDLVTPPLQVLFRGTSLVMQPAVVRQAWRRAKAA